MANLEKSLERAYAKIERSEDEAALDALLGAWRERRLPRIADLVDRISDRLTQARGPIDAKTVKERTAKWIATAKKKDPADVGRLVATPWPGKWQDAQTVLAPLLAFPDDPRIALALAKIVDATPYDTWTSARFYRPLLRGLQKILDPRTLPILEADLEREKSSYWREGTRPFIAAAVEKLNRAYLDGPPALSRAEEAARPVRSRCGAPVRSRSGPRSEPIRGSPTSTSPGSRACSTPWTSPPDTPRS